MTTTSPWWQRARNVSRRQNSWPAPSDVAKDSLLFLYPLSELCETGGYTVFTFVCPCVCEHSVQSSTVTAVGRRLLSVCPKCIRLVREKLITFPYGQHIVGIYVSLAFCIVRFKIEVGFMRNVAYKNVTVISHNVFSTALHAAMTSLSFMATRCTTQQRDHSLVDTH